MIDAARGLFVGQGYAGTTMDQIAADAGVAVQTVYYTFKTKGQLLAEVVEVTAAGDEEPVPVPDRAWAREMLSATSAQRVLALGVEHGTAIYDRVAALWPAVGAAAAVDPAVDRYWRGVTTNRRGGQRAMVERIVELGGLRPGLDADRATDLVVVLLGHDVYRGLVQDAGWSPAAYRTWLVTTLVQQLLATGDAK
jgi:TetR/AcrR family transcriptional regulator of autoinduction and epiphytic fitness